MDEEEKHEFEQLAWIQLSQFTATDLIKAIHRTTSFREATTAANYWYDNQEEITHIRNYVQIICRTKVYGLLDNWATEELNKAKTTKDYYQVPLDYVARNLIERQFSPTQDHSLTPTIYHYNEDWEDISSSSESDQ